MANGPHYSKRTRTALQAAPLCVVGCVGDANGYLRLRRRHRASQWASVDRGPASFRRPVDAHSDRRRAPGVFFGHGRGRICPPRQRRCPRGLSRFVPCFIPSSVGPKVARAICARTQGRACGRRADGELSRTTRHAFRDPRRGRRELGHRCPTKRWLDAQFERVTSQFFAAPAASFAGIEYFNVTPLFLRLS